MFEPSISFTGNVGSEPKLRATPNGHKVCDLRVATTPRIRKGDEWVSGGTLWYDVVCWGRLAENVVESLSKGDPVVVSGKLLNRVWESVDDNGVVTQNDKLTVDAHTVGVDLTRRVAKPYLPERDRPEAGVSDRPAVADAA